jgi:uncharacterized OB-fold protein
VPGKPVPRPTPETAPYWEGARRGELLVQRCLACAQYYFYPRTRCPHCGSADVEWVGTSGRGRLHTYLISHRPAPGFEDDPPYAIAVVELDEGPRMMCNIVGVENTPENLVIDMPLEVTFDDRGEWSVPVFRPTSSSDRSARSD